MGQVDSTFSAGSVPFPMVFGLGEKMRAIRHKLEAVAQTRIPVLIQGESGTGKEVYARFMHARVGNPEGKFVKVSCPAIPAALLETELFGYKKGAFTGAQMAKRGRLEQADGGTLLLDEVGSLDMQMQSKLLQVLQDGTFSPVGGHETQTIHTRLICIANRDLRDQVQEGTFRLDFLYRINAITVNLPALRERTEDLPELVRFFLQEHARAFGTRSAPLSQAVLRQMSRYHWPGNIRQLDNIIRSYVLLGDESAVMTELMEEAEPTSAHDLMADLDVSLPLSLKLITKQMTHDLERQIILKVLKANSWNRQKTAKRLQISYRSLLYKLNEVEAPRIRRMPASAAVKEGDRSTLLRHDQVTGGG